MKERLILTQHNSKINKNQMTKYKIIANQTLSRLRDNIKYNYDTVVNYLK